MYTHLSDLSGLSLTAATEARLYSLLHPGPGASSAAINSYGVTLKALQDPLQTELDCHPNVPKLPSPAGGGQSMVVTSDDILQARAILSWIYSLRGDWQSALRLVPGEEEVGEGWSSGSGGKGDYISVIRIKALVLKGSLKLFGSVLLLLPRLRFSHQGLIYRNCHCTYTPR